MKKVWMVIVMASLVVLGGSGVVMAEGEISEEKLAAIEENCEKIHINLKKVQREDARERVVLGEYYEKILVNFITPLNVRLVENNLSNAELVENQNNFGDARTLFTDDFVSYQRELEGLVAMNCEKPQVFYEKLETVRQKRKTVEQDTLKLRTLLSGHLKLITALKKEL